MPEPGNRRDPVRRRPAAPGPGRRQWGLELTSRDSEHSPDPNLKPPRAACGENAAERRRSEKRVGQIVVDAVCQVERLGAQVDGSPLADENMLHDRYVEIAKSRSRQRIPAAVAEASERRH